MANMIMNVSGMGFRLIHYFHGMQGLTINLLWPALQSKRHLYIEFVNIKRNMFTLHHQLINVGSHLAVIWDYYKVHNKYCIHLVAGREVEIIEHLNSINGVE